jgi:hypothetical protein
MRNRWKATRSNEWKEWLQSFHELRALLDTASEVLASGGKLTARTNSVREIITCADEKARGKTPVSHRYSFSNKSCCKLDRHGEIIDTSMMIDHNAVIDYLAALMIKHVGG